MSSWTEQITKQHFSDHVPLQQSQHRMPTGQFQKYIRQWVDRWHHWYFEFGYLSVGENIQRHFDSSTSLVLRKNREVSTNIVSQSILRIYNEMLVTNVANGCWWRMSVMDVGDDLLSPISKDWCQPRSGCHQNRQWECKYLTRNSFYFILNNLYLICTLSGLNMPLILAVVID